jgi:tetratricopeptide (TPR) repeat protein
VTERGSAAQVVAFVRSLSLRPEEAGTGALYDDLAPLLKRFDEANDAGTDARIAFANQLITLDRAEGVERVLRPVLAADDPSPRAFDIASLAAEKLGKLDQAVAFVNRAVTTAADREVPMEEVRARYGRLLMLHVKQGDDGSPEEFAQALKAAVQTARSWRREDPDNADVDLNVAAALDRLGSREEAERQLYSIIDRHPGEGEGFAKVAAAMEARGNFDEALALWEQAASVEATNPTWLLRQAQLLRARSQPGDLDAARKLLVKIHDQTWQDRFRPQTYEAEQLLKATKK